MRHIEQCVPPMRPCWRRSVVSKGQAGRWSARAAAEVERDSGEHEIDVGRAGGGARYLFQSKLEEPLTPEEAAKLQRIREAAAILRNEFESLVTTYSQRTEPKDGQVSDAAEPRQSSGRYRPLRARPAAHRHRR